jgi:ABC-type polysaccharide/polyol phosphate export permease
MTTLLEVVTVAVFVVGFGLGLAVLAVLFRDLHS